MNLCCTHYDGLQSTWLGLSSLQRRMAEPYHPRRWYESRTPEAARRRPMSRVRSLRTSEQAQYTCPTASGVVLVPGTFLLCLHIPPQLVKSTHATAKGSLIGSGRSIFQPKGELRAAHSSTSSTRPRGAFTRRLTALSSFESLI
ncbi:hypothetical protein OH77DRAFT_973124 [Trametes cingulata]|nr:hypothetical protein OH77DRAFT_973124 [Trametes cingulata]